MISCTSCQGGLCARRLILWRGGWQTPVAVTDVPADILLPEQQWADKEAFAKSLNHLGVLYTSNFKKYASGGGFVSESVAAAITAAGPKM